GRYRVQLLLYAALVRDLGPTPTAAQVRPLGRMPRFVPVTDEAIDEAVLSARADMATYNEAVRSGAVLTLARPSESACQWCEFLIDCPAIWSDPTVDLGKIKNLEGKVIQLQSDQPERLALRLETANGADTVLVTGLSAIRAPALADVAIGDWIRIVGL